MARHGKGAVVPKLMRMGANHVYFAGEILIRVARSAVDVERQLAIAAALKASGVPLP